MCEIRPLVYIGMPIFNAEKTLKRAIEGVLNQTFKDFFLVISDNASTDNTELICREYALKYSNIKYIRQASNIGATKNFEFVLKQSYGKYFAWLAHDDFWEENYVSKCVEVLENNKDCVTAFCHFKVVDIIDKSTKLIFTPTSSSSDNQLYRLKGRVSEMMPSIIYGLHKKEILDKITIENYDCYDVFFTILLSYYGKIFIIPEYLFIAGADGERPPYSLTGKYINLNTFRLRTQKLLRINFSFRERMFLQFKVLYISYKTESIYNKMLRRRNEF